MSNKMDKLKEVAGENVLDTEMLNLIAGGNRAQTEELWNFYMDHGAGGFLKKYANNHAKGVMEALKRETFPKDGALLGMSSWKVTGLSNANVKTGDNIYHTNDNTVFGKGSYRHDEFMYTLNQLYEAGNGRFGGVG